MSEIAYPATTKRFVARNADGSVLHVGVTEPQQVTTTGQPVLEEHDENSVLNALAAFADQFPPLPDAPAPGGEPVTLEAGELYAWDGQVVRVRQRHNRTTNLDPTDIAARALFTIYRETPTDQPLPWVAGEQVHVGELREYNDVVYECIQSHVTQFAPPQAQALWKVAITDEPQPWVQPQGAHDAYNTGDRVTYQGFIWQSSVDANVWAPGVFGWTQIGPV